jgi:hypothetical protein
MSKQPKGRRRRLLGGEGRFLVLAAAIRFCLHYVVNAHDEKRLFTLLSSQEQENNMDPQRWRALLVRPENTSSFQAVCFPGHHVRAHKPRGLLLAQL